MKGCDLPNFLHILGHSSGQQDGMQADVCAAATREIVYTMLHCLSGLAKLLSIALAAQVQPSILCQTLEVDVELTITTQSKL